MLAMVTYPEAQKKAQEELDEIIGRDRMPTFADRDSLPYIQACVRESLRWKTVAPVGVPHVCEEVRISPLIGGEIDLRGILRTIGMRATLFPKVPSASRINGTFCYLEALSVLVIKIYIIGL